MSRGHSLIPIPSRNNNYRMLLVEEGDERDSDGLYSAAQRNAEKELLKTVFLCYLNIKDETIVTDAQN